MLARLFIIFSILSFAATPSISQEMKDDMAGQSTKKTEDALKIKKTDLVIGNKKAPVTIVEYASMSCTHCAAFHNNTFDEINKKYIETGKVKFVFRDFPLDEPALRGAMMARCAGKESVENFLKFTKVMFSTQSNWAPKKNYLEILSNIGKLGGMKGEEFEACIADTKLENSILEGKFEAVNVLDVRSTPTFFINGIMHKGSRDLDYLSGVIDGLLGITDNSASEVKPAE